MTTSITWSRLRLQRLAKPLPSRVSAGHLVVFAAVLFVFIFQIPFLNEPMETDEAIYHLVASSDALPYVEVFDHKPPVIYVWYKLSYVLNGGEASTLTIRLMVTAFLAASAVCVYAIGRLLHSQLAGAIAAVCFALLVANQYLQFGGNTEAFGLLPLTASLLAFLAGWKHGGSAWFLFAGALAMVATLTKTSMGFNLLALFFFLGWMVVLGREGIRRALATGALVAAGSGAVLALVVMPWLVTGHFDSFWQANVTFNLEYSGEIGVYQRLAYAVLHNLHVVQASAPIWILALAGAVSRTFSKNETTLVAIWASMALVGALSTGHSSPHYFVTLVPGASLLAAGAVLEIASKPLRSRIAMLSVLAALGLLALPALGDLYLPRSDEARLAARWGSYYSQRYLTAPQIAARANHLSGRDNSIYLIGQDPQVYLLTNREPPVRAFQLAWLWLDDDLGREALRDLELNPPGLVVDASLYREESGRILDLKAGPAESVAEELTRFLSVRYRLVQTEWFENRLVRFYKLDRLQIPRSS